MTNPAKVIFEKYAETGFYTATPSTESINIKITVVDAKGTEVTDQDGSTTYSNSTVEFTYNNTNNNWEQGSSTVTIPAYFENADMNNKTEISIDKLKPALTSNSPAGDWVITITPVPAVGYGILITPQNGEGVDAYLKRVCRDAYLSWESAKSAKRTVYMDSNIALTDGKASVGSGNAKTIPNLYEAIHDMDTRIDRIDASHGPSTADAGLHITPLVTDNSKKKYASFLRKPPTDTDAVPGIEISVGNGFNIDTGATEKNAANAQDIAGYNMHFRANEITFTVSNPNQIIDEAYLVSYSSDVIPGGNHHCKLNALESDISAHGKTINAAKATGNSTLDKNDHDVTIGEGETATTQLSYQSEYKAIYDSDNDDYKKQYAENLLTVLSAIPNTTSVTGIAVSEFTQGIKDFVDSTATMPNSFPIKPVPGDAEEGAYNNLTSAHDTVVTTIFTAEVRAKIGIRRKNDPEDPYMHEVTDNLRLSFYWVPMEDNNKAEHISEGEYDGEYVIMVGAHGKVFLHLSPMTGTTDAYITTLNTFIRTHTEAVTGGSDNQQLLDAYALARTLIGIFTKNSGNFVYLSHAVTVAEITVGEKLTGDDRLKVTGEMTYNLGAIIEAIQELNRRTMFMDTDISFNGAMSYNDYEADAPNDTIHYSAVMDGLPAGTNSSLSQHMNNGRI